MRPAHFSADIRERTLAQCANDCVNQKLRENAFNATRGINVLVKTKTVLVDGVLRLMASGEDGSMCGQLRALVMHDAKSVVCDMIS